MLDAAAGLGVTHLEQELQLQPRIFAEKKKSLFPTADRIIERYASERAFWITGIIKDSILKAARNHIMNWAKEHPVEGPPGLGFEEGLYETLREWLPVKDAVGRTINTASRSEVIARTNIMDIYNHTRLTTMQQPELRGWVQAYRYTAIIDSVTTPICRALHGKIFTDGTLNGYPPPNHYNAVAEGTLIRTRGGMTPIESVLPGAEVWTHRKRWRKVYAQMGKPSDNGRIRTLLLSSGRRIRITDEHPVLCALPRGGWKLAGDLQAGDVLFEYSEDVAGVQNHLPANPEDFPSLFDEPASAWTIMRLRSSVPMVLPVDFQNDRHGEESEIGNVSSDGMLENEVDTGGNKIAVHNCLMRLGVLPECVREAHGGLFRDSRHPHRVPLLHSHRVGGVNGACLLAEPPSPVCFASLPVGVGLAVSDGNLLDAGPDRDPVAFAPIAQGGLSNSDIAFDGSERFTLAPMPFVDDGADDVRIGQVGSHDSPPGWVLSTIISIVDEEYKGNVWNLAVEEDETYLAEDVIVHNCRSMLLPVTRLDHGWQEQMLQQGRIDVKPQEGFATPTVTEGIAVAGRLS